MIKYGSYIRPQKNPNNAYWCVWCMHSDKQMLRIRINGNTNFMCRTCADSLALAAHNYLMPSPDVHFGIGREPETFYYPSLTQIRIHCYKMYHECDRKIQAIKDLRSVSGLGLKDSKEQVEAWASGSVGWISNRIASDYRSNVKGHLHDVQDVWRNILKQGYNKRVVY